MQRLAASGLVPLLNRKSSGGLTVEHFECVFTAADVPFGVQPLT